MASTFGLNDIVERITWSNACKTGSMVLAAHMVQVGLWAYTYPRGLCKAFGMRYDGQAFNSATAAIRQRKEEKNHENFWPLLFAPREVGFGIMILVLGGLGEWRATGVVVGTVGGLLAVTDGVVAGLFGEGGWNDAVKSHLVPAALIMGMATPLLMA